MVDSKSDTRDHGIRSFINRFSYYDCSGSAVQVNYYLYVLAITFIFSIGVLIIGGIFVVLELFPMLPDVFPPPAVLVLIVYALLLISISVFISVFIHQVKPEALAESEKQRVGTIKAIEKKENFDQSERIKTFFNSINDAIFVHPLKEEGFAPFIEVNAKACERYGYTYDEFMNLSAPDITVKPDVNGHGKPGYRKELLKKGQLIFETVHIKKSGEIFPVEINSTIFYEDETPFILAVVRDITERKKAEEKREALITELQEAFDNIKTLKGLLPICSCCNRIRNDQGYWDNLELYIETHSDAQFSHGLCPECLDTLYGDQEWYIKRKKKKEYN